MRKPKRATDEQLALMERLSDALGLTQAFIIGVLDRTGLHVVTTAKRCACHLHADHAKEK